MPNFTRLHLLWPGLLAALFLALFFTTPLHAQGPSDGLVGYWPFDKGSGSTSTDRSAHRNTATLQSGAKLVPLHATTAFSNTGSLASAPVANSYATAATNLYPIPGRLTPFTIAFWVHANPPQVGASIW